MAIQGDKDALVIEGKKYFPECSEWPLWVLQELKENSWIMSEELSMEVFE